MPTLQSPAEANIAAPVGSVPNASSNDAALVKRLKVTERVASQLAEATELISRLQSAVNLEDACARLVSDVASHCNADHVAVGALNPRHGHVRVISDTRSRSTTVSPTITRGAEIAMQEALIRGVLTHWPASSDQRHATECHRQYASASGTDHLVTIPLCPRDKSAWGALLIGFKEPPSTVSLFAAASESIASTLRLMERSQRSRWHQKTVEFFSDVGRDRRRICGVAMIVITLLLLIPIRYHVKADCRIEPTHRQFVAAPFDARLSECRVVPGDVVKAGQVIARLDGKEIRWELDAINADLQRARRERAGHVAGHESGKANLVAHEIEHLVSRQSLLQNRIEQLTIRSPIDGVVIAGDLDDAVGAPLKTGQTLVEVASLENMIAELSIPESDIHLVEKNQSVSVQLHAFGGERMQTRLTSIHPRTESRDQQNVFIAETPLGDSEPSSAEQTPKPGMHPNSGMHLKPGMNGTARVASVYRPIGWILFRKPVVTLRLMTGW